MTKKVCFLLLAILGIGSLVLSRSIICPIDVFTGKERIVTSRQFPNGDRIEVVQYWNEGDFYNLDLRHTAKDGTQHEFVIDPDCLRVPKCNIDFNSAQGDVIITAGHGIWACYRLGAKELLRKNGVLIRSDQASNQ